MSRCSPPWSNPERCPRCCSLPQPTPERERASRTQLPNHSQSFELIHLSLNPPPAPVIMGIRESGVKILGIREGQRNLSDRLVGVVTVGIPSSSVKKAKSSKGRMHQSYVSDIVRM